MTNRRILVVEDDMDGREVVQHILRYHNIPADIVSDGEAAIEQLVLQDYAAAIIDLSLPKIDGWTLLSTIRSDPKTAKMPCVAVTAFHSAEVAIKAIEAGFVAYFPKPLDPTSFVRELERVLA
ncbi:MAG: response regulator [Chloroflexota bacterium]